jgi:tetratricopeptide (TPR) repeat protein
VLQFADATSDAADQDAYGDDAPLGLVEQLEQEALDWIDAGQLSRAAETYRTILMASGPTAETLFSLADVLYRSGDLSAARERFYAVLELDEEFVEARANLGCVLNELGELELAVSAFEGALQHHPDFADVHFHIAGTLDQLHRSAEAAHHFRAFLSLAPESPWAVAARDRLAQLDDAPSEAEPALPFAP